MKLLSELLQGIEFNLVSGSLDQYVEDIQFDSRSVNEKSLFVALKGSQVDGHQFIDSVFENGCKVILVQNNYEITRSNITVIKVQDSASALGILSSNFYNNPSNNLNLIGITGTNGKTTCCTLLYELFMKMGHKSGLISTVVNRIGNLKINATHTTPDPIQLNSLLARMVEEGCEYCFMEVSSHAIHQHRISGLYFRGGAFTNISHDHLDYHKTFKEYIGVKKQFFDQLKESSFSLSNQDDKNGKVMLQNTKSLKRYYSLKTETDFKAKIKENSFSGLLLSIDGIELLSPLVGSFNTYNLLVVYGVSMLLGLEKNDVLRNISALSSVDGRFECIKSNNGVYAIIDYAHTPDALENVLHTIRDVKVSSQKIICVVGCGGDRDKLKRPIMASIAVKHCDSVILTSDNPRSEDPQVILDEMEAGVQDSKKSNTLQILDRLQAIKTAFKIASKNDIILIAGKGHEKYQEINGVRYDFDDLEIVKELFNQTVK